MATTIINSISVKPFCFGRNIFDISITPFGNLPSYIQRHYFLPLMVENSSCRGGLYARLKSGPSGSWGGVEPRPYEMNIYTHARLIMSSCIGENFTF